MRTIFQPIVLCIVLPFLLSCRCVMSYVLLARVLTQKKKLFSKNKVVRMITYKLLTKTRWLAWERDEVYEVIMINELDKNSVEIAGMQKENCTHVHVYGRICWWSFSNSVLVNGHVCSFQQPAPNCDVSLVVSTTTYKWVMTVLWGKGEDRNSFDDKLAMVKIWYKF